MGLFNDVWRAIVSPHDRAFVSRVEAAAAGREVRWDDDHPDLFTVPVHFRGRTYFLCGSPVGEVVLLTVSSRVPFARCPPDAEAALRRRNAELPWGDWKRGERRYYVTARIRLHNLTRDNLEYAIECMVPEVAAFDEVVERRRG